MKKEIAIIGGGIAGLTTAIALNQKGYQPHIFEAANEIKAVGAGLALAANAMRGFNRLGIMEEVVEKGRLLPFFSILDQKGSLITKADSQIISKKYGLDNFLIHRAELHRVLISKIDPSRIHTGKKAKSFRYCKDKVEVLFEDGTAHLSDFLIVADGIHSSIRKQLYPDSRPRYAGYTCWRGVIDNSRLNIAESSETWGSKGRFGIAPLAKGQLYWFACINATENNPQMKEFKVSDLSKYFGDYHHPIPGILKTSQNEDLIWNDILDLKPLPRYAFERIVLIGDAGHATTPNMGQGACQAIEDGVILADEIEKQTDVQKAFQTFDKRRLERTHYVTNTSWKVGKIAQWENPLGCAIRNFFFRNLPKSINENQIDKVLKTDF